jgi:hypothetical protein
MFGGGLGDCRTATLDSTCTVVILEKYLGDEIRGLNKE